MDDGDDDLPAQPRADKLHVALLDLLGIRLDGSGGRHHQPALPLCGRRRASRSSSRRGETGSARRAPSTTSRSSTSVDEDFTIPPMTPVAYVLQRAGRRSRTSAWPTASARPAGLGPARLRHPAEGRRPPVPRLRGPAAPPVIQIDVDALPGARRGRQPGGPTPLRWEVSQGDNEWAPAEVLRGPHRRLQLRLRRGRAAASAALGDRADRRPAPVLAALPDHGHDPRPAATARPTRTRRRSTRSPPP